MGPGLSTGAERRALAAAGGGREELRAALLRPYLLRLAEQKGEDAVHAVLAHARLKRSEIDHDSVWVPVASVQRALEALAEQLGEDALGTRGTWSTHPEVLGIYVRLLRVATRPLDAYRHLAENSGEYSRVGNYQFTHGADQTATLVYHPRPEGPDQSHRLLCDLRQAELRSLPRLWGLPEATLNHTSCIARGDAACTYVLRWTQGPRAHAPLGALLGALAGAGAVQLLVSDPGIGSLSAGTLIGATWGGSLGHLAQRLRADRQARTLERHRIAALEHGLDQRGHYVDSQGALINTVLGGKYRILRRIGSGGIGAVYAAEHLALGYQVAVKVLRGAAAADGAEIARLRREARVQVSIEHPNVVRTMDLDQMPDGSIYVVMELLQGMSLQEHLVEKGPVAPGFAIPIFLQVCRALSAAHRLGIVHRDLKPGNVFIGDDQLVKVLDFGMSKLAEADALTQDGYTLGTPEYMSPEQCIGAPVDPRSDLYAFGVLMYEALTGELPLSAQTRRDLLDMHQRAIPEPMRERRPDLDVPPELDRIVMACLKKRAAERPESAQQLERLLASIPPAHLVYEYPKDTPRHAERRPSLRPSWRLSQRSNS